MTTTFSATFPKSDVRRLVSDGYSYGEWRRIVVDAADFQIVAIHPYTVGTRVKKWERRSAEGVERYPTKHAALASVGR